MIEIARRLVGRRGLTVVTPSLRVVNTLVANKDIRLIVTGGVLRPGEESLVGELAQRTFEGLFVDKLFLAVAGVDARHGVTEYNWEDALVKKAMIRSAKKVILAADASKFVAGLADIHALVTNEEPPRELSQHLTQAGVAVAVAGDDDGIARHQQAHGTGEVGPR